LPARPEIREVPKRGILGRVVAGNLEALLLGVKYFLDPNRFTLMYPHEYIKLDTGYRGFIVLIYDKCIGCGSCARICPTRAMRMIFLPQKEGERARKKYPVINYNRCVFCGYCVDICPTEALYHVPYHDIVYHSMQELVLTLDEFQKEPEYATAKEGIPVRYVFDEKRGLVKVKAEEKPEEKQAQPAPAQQVKPAAAPTPAPSQPQPQPVPSAPAPSQAQPQAQKPAEQQAPAPPTAPSQPAQQIASQPAQQAQPQQPAAAERPAEQPKPAEQAQKPKRVRRKAQHTEDTGTQDTRSKSQEGGS
jgi:NADH-quinone oxidoreductase subunit I